MDPRSVTPPSAEELQAFSLGKCAPERAGEIEAFLSSTADCGGQPGAFRAWLRTILTHRVRHFLRGQRNRNPPWHRSRWPLLWSSSPTRIAP
jgi:hypothetical protein